MTVAAALVAFAAGPARAQLGTLASPGPLSKAHASLEGLSKCQSCHEPGRQVTAAKCLACHAPIAARIAQKKGVHRDVGGECARCHVEHNGVDAELRPIDLKAFDHRAETGFALDGRHAGVACARCHATRSFLKASPACASCHADPHKGTLGPTCSTCHSTDVPFKQAAQQFDHSRAAFPLTGRHQQVACAKCHVNGRFRGIAFSSCASCHAEPHAKKFGADCAACHTTSQWKTLKVDHAKTGFPLVGRHQDVPCARCHVQPAGKVHLKFAKCSDCHTDPHKGRFKAGCESCHKESGFSNTPFDHAARTTFALTGKHATLECVKCHKGIAPKVVGTARVIDFGGAKTDCAACHGDPHKGELGTACATCHGTESFQLTAFTHPRTPEFYAGEHAKVPCAGCHARAPVAPTRTGAPAAGMTFKNVPTACASCHTDVHLGQLGAACERCHAITAPKFAAVGFSHDRAGFVLTGRHQQVACEKCHVTVTAGFPAGPGQARRYKGLGTDCASCHKDVHLGQLGTRCAACHTTAAFAVPKYTHATLQGFFVGAHAGLECVQCHKKEEGAFPAGRGIAVRFVVGKDCTSCHKDAHSGAMGPDCASCHTPDMWRNPNRAFHKVTVFPLTGRHLAVPCASCHVRGQIKGTPTRCYDCHWIRRQDDFYRLRLGNQCEDCHKTTSWTAVTWDHGARTGTPLNIAHRLLACDSCHKNRVFEGSRPECVACHQADYQRTTNPNHAAAGFPLACDVCHNPSSPTFAGARFSHASYPLRGAHATQSCDSCHRNGIYTGTSRDCVSCHLKDYQRTQSPNHAAAGFPTACQSCHREGGPGWAGGSGFNHAATFPLNGAHATTACTACHKNGVYKGTARDCFSCHQADYQRTTDPNHAAAGFPTSCEQCHRSGGPGWNGSFNHSTVFALSGLHATTACTSCHKNGVYKGTPRECFACHQAQYQRTTNPNHAAAGFPTSCDQCHKSGGPGWSGALNHSQFFPLQGVHATQPCSACHRNGVYKGTPRTCVGCHLPKYQGTRDPNHAAAGFPTTCDTCHRATDTSWSQGRFNHTWFPITSGRHAGNPCSACHQSSGNFQSFTCLTCHTRAETDSHHQGRAGYRYESTACYTCHPTGRSD